MNVCGEDQPAASQTSWRATPYIRALEDGQDVYIVDPRDVSCSKRQQFPLRPQEDLARKFASGRDCNLWFMVIYVGDHWCVVWVDEHMVAPEIC